MATGTGNLPNPGMSFSPFAILTAEEQNDLVENIESLATGSGIGDTAITTAKIASKAVTSDKIDWATTASDTNYDSGWVIPTYATLYATSTLQYRKIGNVVYIRGQANRNTGTPASGETPFTLPVGFRPTNNFITIAMGSATNTGKWEIQSGGAVNLAAGMSGGSYAGLTTSFPVG